MSPLQRLNRRVGRFRYFKRSEYDNLYNHEPILLPSFFNFFNLPYSMHDQLDAYSRWLLTIMIYINLQMFLYPYIWNSIWSPLTCYMPYLLSRESREYEHRTWIFHLFVPLDIFAARYAMQLRGLLCRHAVSVCLFVCPSVRLSRLWVVSKRINVSSNFLTIW